MAKKPNSTKRRIENYTHPKKKRVNNPPVGLLTPGTDRDAGKTIYAYRNPGALIFYRLNARCSAEQGSERKD